MLLENLKGPGTRRRIREEVLAGRGDWENLCGLATPDGVLLLGLEKEENRRWRGRTLAEVAEATGKDWVEAAMDLIVSEEQRIGTIFFLMSEENVELQLRQPWIKFGTDAGGVDPDSADGLVHPRAYGTFPRILGKYVREEGVLPLEEAVRKASSAVATRLGIQDRGLVREGMYADLAVFDPRTIRDRATFEDPHRVSVGVEHVFVNGVAVVRDGRHTGATPGRIVRGPGWTGGDGGG
jgi:dihydroorotase/N-acyl-D-amino-acid deacylase